MPKTHHLPSPKPTHHSSTDEIPFSSSSADLQAKPRTKQAISLRERLIPPKKPAPVLAAKVVRPTDTKKPSVAPFFQRVEAAFQDKPPAAAHPNHTNATAGRQTRSFSPDTEDLIQQLREHYLQTATTLHKQATTRLAQTHADLARRLTQSLRERDEPFLAEAEARIARLAQPLDRFRVRSRQQQNQTQQGGGPLRAEEHVVGELVARAAEQLAAFEDEVGRLWREWAVAEAEVKKLLGGVVAAVSGLGVGGGGVLDGGKGCDGEGEEMLRRFAEAVEREIAEAEEEVVALGEEAVGMMKAIERDFRKATLSDLHTFFQSIDEP